ncbi:LuxR C-terminal-related transcriptional regulator [Nocardia sp. NPDC051787]|uniref:LuxR C-terminal-related transcriptional regulator n=1 Tax=Nocardia sp. NPDC051787 TaxID=3155415 RepID=UPI0034394511
MTAAEARVAAATLRGEGLRPIAEELAVSVNTARTHLQHVFHKTGTHRQVELVRVLTTVLAGDGSARRNSGSGYVRHHPRCCSRIEPGRVGGGASTTSIDLWKRGETSYLSEASGYVAASPQCCRRGRREHPGRDGRHLLPGSGRMLPGSGRNGFAGAQLHVGDIGRDPVVPLLTARIRGQFVA